MLTSRLTREMLELEGWEPAEGGPGAPGKRTTTQGIPRIVLSQGEPLRADVRERFESSLGADLSAVRVHTGEESAASAAAAGARAYAVGNDIHFGAGQYQPDDPFGLHLIAHEVAHTQQQAGGAPTPQFKRDGEASGDAAEVEADRAADAMTSGGPSDADKKKMAEAEEQCGAISAIAQANGQLVLSNGDVAVGIIKGALDHLRANLNAYSTAYENVKKLLQQAQRSYEIEKAVTGAVKDLVLGSALGVIAPEARIVMAMTAVKNEKGQIVSSLGDIGAGIAGTAIGAANSAAGKATSDGPEPVAPKESISGVGFSPGDKALEAFETLGEMVGSLPALGMLGGAIKDIGIVAGRVATEAVKVGAGQKSKVSVDDIVGKVKALAALAGASAGHVAKSNDARVKMQVLANGVTAAKSVDVQTIEDKMWLNWLASRKTRDDKELINIDVIERHLVARGLMTDPGKYMSDQDEDKAVTEAQKKILSEKGIKAPDDAAKVASLYGREMKRDELIRTYGGKRGTISAENQVDVGGVSFSCPGNAGAKVGDPIKVMWFNPKEHRQSNDLIVAEWAAGDFDCFGQKAEE
jgi:hypothetical protein